MSFNEHKLGFFKKTKLSNSFSLFSAYFYFYFYAKKDPDPDSWALSRRNGLIFRSLKLKLVNA